MLGSYNTEWKLELELGLKLVLLLGFIFLVWLFRYDPELLIDSVSEIVVIARNVVVYVRYQLLEVLDSSGVFGIFGGYGELLGLGLLTVAIAELLRFRFGKKKQRNEVNEEEKS